MTAFFDALFAAGPMAGWLLAGLALGAGLYLYATDRLISKGRHLEQRENYEQALAQQHANHQQQVEALREHMRMMLAELTEQLRREREDRDFWRDTTLDGMNIAAAAIGRDNA